MNKEYDSPENLRQILAAASTGQKFYFSGSAREVSKLILAAQTEQERLVAGELSVIGATLASSQALASIQANIGK